jgi:hypothetical protein
MPPALLASVRRTVSPRGAATGCALLAYGWWLTGRQPFTLGALFALLGAAAATIALAARHHVRNARDAPHAGMRHARYVVASAFAWSLAVVVVVSWELLAWFSQPRSEHPTISSLLEHAMHHHGLRFVVYLLWLALGWAIVS